ncbi:hypothetical protein SETIT_6G143600v2 [Setaria italica]|uniref:Uncharacterized protein n=1 Tax=Setaria italica TaxID=4555 RepID=K3YI61_SETIT|nr:hypothetical protein SETIT_6G143600v2 [Setaria italica]
MRKVKGHNHTAIQPLHHEPLHQHRSAGKPPGVLLLVHPPAPVLLPPHPLPHARAHTDPLSRRRRPKPHVPVAVPRAPHLLLRFHAPTDERPVAGQLRDAGGVRVHRLPALFQRHLVERAALHLLARRDAAFYDDEERGVPFPDGSRVGRRRERVEDGGVGELAGPEGGVEAPRLAELEVLGLGRVHAPALLAVEEVREAIGGDGPRREPPPPARHDLDLLVDVRRVERPGLDVADAPAEAARDHVLLARARPDEAPAPAGGDDGVVAVGRERLVGDGDEHDGVGVGGAALAVLLRVPHGEHAVLREREVTDARPAACAPAASLAVVAVVVGDLHHEVAGVPALRWRPGRRLRVALEQGQRLGRVHFLIKLIWVSCALCW